MTTDKRFAFGLALMFPALLLQLSSRNVGKLLISADFTRGFCIGLSIMMYAVAVALLVQSAHGAKKAKPDRPADR